MLGSWFAIPRRLLLTAAFSLLGQLAFLMGDASAQGRTISSLPATITSADNNSTITLSGNLSSTTGVFYFNNGVHGVTIDMGGYAATWGTAGTPNTTAITYTSSGSGGSCYDNTIRNGSLIHLPPVASEDPEDGLSAMLCRLGHPPGSGSHYNLHFKKLTLTIRGYNGQFFFHEGGDYNIEVDSCNFASYSTSFYRRDQWIASALNVFVGNVALTTPGLNYTIKWTNNTVTSAPWCNLYLQGETLKALVYGNHFFTDGINTSDLYPGTAGSTAAQNYMLSIRYGNSAIIGGKSIVNCYNNTFRSGTAHAGGRGIFVSSIDGYSLHPDSSIYIHDNDIEVHQGWDEEERTLNAIIVRQGVSNIYIRNNIITCIGNANNPSGSYDVGPMACLRLTGSPMLDGLKIVGNTLTSYFVGGVNPDYSTSGPNGQGIIFDAYEMNMPNVTIDSNTFNTDNCCIRWGFYNGNAGSSVFRNNTYGYRSGRNGYVFYLGGSGGSSESSIGNIDRDGIFIGGAAPTDIFMNDGETDPMDIAIEATLKVTVLGSNSQPVDGAQVRITNAYGTQVGYLTTGSTGIINQNVRYLYQANSARGADSTGYNLLTIKAKKLTDSTTITYSVGANTKSATVTLYNTSGGGASIDTIPPGRIFDLGAACDSLGEGVRLTWTATGDDGTTGQASSYDIRYSLNRISEANFAAASVAPDPPAPKPSGQVESFLVTVPDNTSTYYFALKAYDDVGLSSGLGGPTEYSPANIRAPTLDTVVIDETNRLVTLSVNPVPSCQQTYFEFNVDSNVNFPAPIVAVDSVPEPSASATIGGLLDNTVYFWRCRAVATDGSLASAYMPTRSMMPFVTMATGCDSLELVDPAGGDTVFGLRPTLVVRNASSEPNVYFFELDDSTDFQTLVASDVVHQQVGDFTSWALPLQLEAGTKYFWRARVNNCAFPEMTSFVVSQKEAFAFPNPFRPDLGQRLTFARIAPNSNLVIMTVSGDLVRYWQDVGGEDITWDGTNMSGNPVATGIYVWTVEPGSLGGKIIVLR